ncbi:MAG TPA: DNA-processing protein DprA [Bacteroidales bacterium]|nr:DNA-processing protein DprA [Bacteroidales bacterium]HPJ58131.1 DNA-processing protein DprA [Bacteroidales bacterium]HPR12476.1 DNA-processing protein DprA [Bacteroidales bacterium]HRW84541.1 DNA-processing protein DprA [Bacteroidales bacterium]
MSEDVSLKHKIALGLIPRVGDISARKLVAHFGNVEAVFNESYRNLTKIPGIGPGLAKYICDRSYLEAAEREAEYVSGHDIRTFFYLDSDYPYRLKQCEDSPVVFFFRGNCDLDSAKILSVVGTRSATARGREICEKIIGGLANRHPDLMIVSGLAYGIDIAAHKAALSFNLATVGVLANGLKTIYPSVHRNTADLMLKKGGLLTDFLSDALPERNNFIKRNRIIAGLSDATLVVESGVSGGALITADIAASYNRDVMAVPGRPDDQWSGGCNSLIKSNKAALVENADDVEFVLGWQPDKINPPIQRTLFTDMDESEKMIFDLLSRENEMTIDAICRKLDLPVQKLSPTLLQMELRGLVKFFPGNLYRAN